MENNLCQARPIAKEYPTLLLTITVHNKPTSKTNSTHQSSIV